MAKQTESQLKQASNKGKLLREQFMFDLLRKLIQQKYGN